MTSHILLKYIQHPTSHSRAILLATTLVVLEMTFSTTLLQRIQSSMILHLGSIHNSFKAPTKSLHSIQPTAEQLRARLLYRSQLSSQGLRHRVTQTPCNLETHHLPKQRSRSNNQSHCCHRRGSKRSPRLARQRRHAPTAKEKGSNVS